MAPTARRPARGRRPRRAVSPEQHPAPSWQTLEEQTDWAKVVYYGDSGTGKTTALASMAKMGPVLVVNAESGLKKRPLRGLGIPVDQIQTTRVTGFDDAEALTRDLHQRFEDDPSCLLAVLIDSITEIETVLMNEGLSEEVRKAQLRGVDRDVFLTEGDDWVRNNAKMRRFIRRLRDLPCHVGFSALSRRDIDEEGVVMYRPALGPQVAGVLVAYCDISVAMQPFIVQPRHRDIVWGITRRQGKWSGKDRFRILPAQMPYPSLDRIVAYLEGSLTAKTDPEVAAFRAYRDRNKET